MIDVVIAGAGPSGLSAALCLARVGRQVLVLDGGPWRGASSDAMHNLFTRDGATVPELRESALAQLRRYPCVKVQAGSAEAAEGEPGNFRITLSGGRVAEAHRLILATGVEDLLPDIPGLPERWGQSVVPCPYCDGWERAGLALGVLALDEWAVHQAIQVQRISDEVVLCMNGTGTPTQDQRKLLEERGVAVREEPLARLEGPGTTLERLRFADGSAVACQALFCHPPTRQRSDLPARLGCRLLGDGAVEVNDYGQTSRPGIYAVGDMAHPANALLPGHSIAQAVAKGQVAAMVIDQELLYND
jgi:thioredoxin reductase